MLLSAANHSLSACCCGYTALVNCQFYACAVAEADGPHTPTVGGESAFCNECKTYGISFARAISRHPFI